MLSENFPESSALLAPVLGALSANLSQTDDFLISSGLSPLASTYNTPMQTSRLRNAWEMGAAILERPDFGTAVGLQVTPATFDILSYLVTSAPTLRDSMRIWERNLGLLTLRGRIVLKEWDHYALLQIDWGTEDPRELSPHGGAFFVASMIAYARMVIGNHWQAIETRIGVPMPQSCVRELHHCADSPLVSTPGCNGLLFRRELLDERSQTADPKLHAVLLHAIETGYEPVGPPPVARQTATSQTQVAIHHIFQSDRRFAQIEEVAQRLGIRARTLQRQLQQEHSNFRSVLTNVRKELAHVYVSADELQLHEVARILGFDSPPAFSRAYRNWHGCSPSAARDKAAAFRDSNVVK